MQAAEVHEIVFQKMSKPLKLVANTSSSTLVKKEYILKDS